MRNDLFKIFVLCLVLCLNFSACGFSQENYTNNKAANFTLQELSGRSISLSDFKDKGVVLFFWATWCPHCRSALTMLDNEYKNMQAADIKLVSIDISEPNGTVEKFKQKHSITYPILMDSQGSVSQKYGVLGVPTFVVISKKGEIVSFSNSLPDNYKELVSK